MNEFLFVLSELFFLILAGIGAVVLMSCFALVLGKMIGGYDDE